MECGRFWALYGDEETAALILEQQSEINNGQNLSVSSYLYMSIINVLSIIVTANLIYKAGWTYGDTRIYLNKCLPSYITTLNRC